MDMSLLSPGHDGPMVDSAALHWSLARGGLTPGGETCPGLAAVPRWVAAVAVTPPTLVMQTSSM